MAFVCHATWVAKPGHEETVRAALAQVAPASRAEPGALYYQPYQDPAEPRVFRIFEVYADEDAFRAHSESEHFKRWVLGEAVPVLESRQRDLYQTLDV